MKCKRCHSRNGLVSYKGIIYCRDCILFKRVLVNQELEVNTYIHENDKANYYLDYALSPKQKHISQIIQSNYLRGINTIVQAVCGSGKTEIVYDVIILALKNKQHVGFSVPRRELAVELYNRFNSQLFDCKISLVYGGYTEDLDADLVICTTHQLFRYHQSFDLLIIDEVDAFPFYGNDVLKEIAIKSCKGYMILLSATLNKFDIDFGVGFDEVTMYRRYHCHDLPIPRIKILPNCFVILDMYLKIIKYKKENKLVLLFVPTIEKTKDLYKVLSVFKLKAGIVHSKISNKDEILEKFRTFQYEVLITTTLLERGVTFSNVQVFVFNASHPVFNVSTLIQIAGRVGRKIDYPNGDIIFYDQKKSWAMKKCIKEIKKMNVA